MNYSETITYLYEKLPMFQRVGASAYKKDLTNTLALAEFLDNPQTAYKVIHVAGTNGKGSTAHLLAAILQSAGYKVGLHTSPHYQDFRERSRVNGALMEAQFVVDFVERVRPMIEKISPSFFEISVVMGFEYFRQQEVDIAVVEVGMGGRLDSTNIVNPDLCIVTNIGLDHTQFLGDTLPLIAAEKAGIIKPKIPVVVSEYHPETAPVFKQKAAECAAPLWFAEACLDAVLERQDYAQEQAIYQIRRLATGTHIYPNLSLELLGAYQNKNLQGVLQSVEVLQGLGYHIPEKAVYEGCQKVKTLTGMQGRWQILQQTPLVIADAAHNPHGLEIAMQQLAQLAPEHLHFVLGAVADKDLETMFGLLPKTNTTYYFCNADIPRAKPAQNLASAGQSAGLQGQAYASVLDAYQTALAAAQKNPSERAIVYVGGSIFVIGELLKNIG